MLFAADSAAGVHWPQWRGPAATGSVPDANPPVTWSETSNVKWKYAIPGYGTSTPILWGDQVFVLTAVPTGKKAPATPPAAATDSPPPPPGGGRRGGPGGGMSEAPTEVQAFTVIAVDRRTGQPQW